MNTTPHHTTPHRSRSWLSALFLMGAVLFSSLSNDVRAQCTLCSGSQNIQIGLGSATGTLSYAFGNATSQGDYGFSIGSKVFANGDNSFVIGYKAKADPSYSFNYIFGAGTEDDDLLNDVSNSIMFGVNSNLSTIIVSGASGYGTWGNVGIGNITSPASLLHVRDQVRVGLTSGANGSLVFNNSAGNTITFNTPTSMGTQSYILPTAIGTNGDVLGLGVSGQLQWVAGSTGAAGWLLTGNTGTTAGTNFLGTTDDIDLVIKTNGTEKMRVKSGGNVGIGTATPDGILHVDNGSSNTDLVIEKDNATSGSIIFHNDGSAVASIVNNASEQLVVSNATSDQDILMNINDGGTTRTLVTLEADDAQVGINRTAPTAGLDVEALAVSATDEVVGRFTVTDASDNDRIAIENITTTNAKFAGRISGLSEETDKPALTIRAYAWDDEGTQPVMEFQSRSVTTIATRPIYKWSGHNTTYMTMIPVPGDSLKAYLGIGTPTPKNRVDVEGGLAVGASYSGTSTAPTDGAIIQGNVGIGTTTPSGKLHVNGTVFAALTATSATSMVVYNPTTDELIDGGASTIYFKENVEDLSFDKEAFLNLRPTNFNWKPAQGGQADVGLIAQEVMETFPELAYSGPKRTYFEDGSMLLDSLGIPVVDTTQNETWGVRYHKIPIYLMSIVKGQQEEIAEMRNQLIEMAQQVNNCCSSGPMHRIDETQGDVTEVKDDLEEFILLGNDPNPFSDHTDIRFDASACNKCEIVIVDMNGRIVKRILTKGRAGTARIYSSEIGTGYFVYSLIQDGQVLRSERMVSAR